MAAMAFLMCCTTETEGQPRHAQSLERFVEEVLMMEGVKPDRCMLFPRVLLPTHAESQGTWVAVSNVRHQNYLLGDMKRTDGGDDYLRGLRSFRADMLESYSVLFLTDIIEITEGDRRAYLELYDCRGGVAYIMFESSLGGAESSRTIYQLWSIAAGG